MGNFRSHPFEKNVRLEYPLESEDSLAAKRSPWLTLSGPFGLTTEWGVSDLRLSPDGRYAFCFSYGVRRFVVLDLVRHTQLAFHSKERERTIIQDFAVISPSMIVALQVDSLRLIRLDVESGTFEWLGWGRRPGRATAFVFKEIRGRNVHLKQAVLNCSESERISFIRLDIDRGQLEEMWTERPNFTSTSYRLSEDGRSLYAISRADLSRLHVYDIKSGTWSWMNLTGDIPRFHQGLFYFSSPEHAYFAGRVPFGKPRHSIFCCDLDRLEWKHLSIMTAHELLHIASFVDEEGEHNGMMLVEKNTRDNQLEFHRFLYRQALQFIRPLTVVCRTPDSLLRLAVDALRRSHIGVKRPLGFHRIMSTECGKKILPSAYPDMQPIPRFVR
ncbi:hypothetical protein M3Y99_00947900 [Aphelenchoides fujianensis]|nr:hypothetical protein M3Y99_00947900 [Aphelenchoides fujianensis]